MGFEGDSGGGFGSERDASDFGGGFGVEGGGAGYGGYGGVGGSGLGGGSAAEGFGGSGGYSGGQDTGFQADKAFRDVLNEVEQNIAAANRTAQEQAASKAPEYDIPGPQKPEDIERAPPEDRGFVGRVGQALKGYFTNRAVQTGIQLAGQYVPAPVLSVPLSIGSLALAKYRGATPSELEAMAGRTFGNVMTGGMFTGIQAIGRAAQAAAIAAGAKGGPQPGMGEQAPTGVEGEDVYSAVERARETGELTRQTPPELLREARAYREV